MKTFLFNSGCTKMLTYSINFAYFLRLFPIKWEEDSSTIKFINLSLNPLKRSIIYTLAIYWVQLLYNIMEDINSLTLIRIKYLSLSITTFGAVTIMLSISYSIEFASADGRDLILTCNRLLKYYDSLQGNYMKACSKC